MSISLQPHGLLDPKWMLNTLIHAEKDLGWPLTFIFVLSLLHICFPIVKVTRWSSELCKYTFIFIYDVPGVFLIHGKADEVYAVKVLKLFSGKCGILSYINESDLHLSKCDTFSALCFSILRLINQLNQSGDRSHGAIRPLAITSDRPNLSSHSPLHWFVVHLQRNNHMTFTAEPLPPASRHN